MTQNQLADEFEFEAQEVREEKGCPKCNGVGMFTVQNGADDFDWVECPCLESTENEY